MKTNISRLLALVAALLTTQLVTAQAPSGAPANATGLCKDGTYYTGENKQGACRGHQGVKEWYGSAASTGKTAPASGAPSATAGTSAASSSTANPPASPAQSEPSTKSKTSTMAQAPGGSPDKVWLNTASNVYHCPGTKYYGKTKAGEYVSEAQAQAKGAHPDHGKPCK